jgi:uncharacterized membrane protein YhhN
VTSLALIPEVVSFAVIAGVDPKVALYTSCIMAMTIAFVGGRPAMVSAAAGATALVIAPLVASHGLDYLIAAVWLAGALQIVLAAVGLALVAGLAAVVGRRVVPAATREGGAALGAAVTAYMVVIAVMVVAAWATGHPLVALGATVFMLSDAVLAMDRFVSQRRFGSLAVMVTYHLGQVLLVVGVLTA